jgi:DNA-binding IclR family transcriptional regulator
MSSSARRALRILQTVGAGDRPLGVTEIGRRLDLPPGTVFRGLDALERAGYVARYRESSRYVLGGTVARLRQNLFAGFPIRDICTPYLRQLAFASGETTSLTVPVGWYAVRIAAAPGTNEVTSSAPLGQVRLLASDVAGRAILAFQPRATDASFSAWAARHGRRSPPFQTLAADLRAIRERGFAVEETAFARGRAALALPICGADRAIAAISVDGPVLDLGDPAYHSDLARWVEIVRPLENLVRARPMLFVNPFDHLDPDGIVLADGG